MSFSPKTKADYQKARLNGKNITYKTIPKLPTRNDFLDEDAMKALNIRIENKEPIDFLPIGLYENHWQDEKYGQTKYKILLTGIFKDGRRSNIVLN